MTLSMLHEHVARTYCMSMNFVNRKIKIIMKMNIKQNETPADTVVSTVSSADETKIKHISTPDVENKTNRTFRGVQYEL
jgi:hypothetical protein